MINRFHYIPLTILISFLLLLTGCASKAKVTTEPGALTKTEIQQLVSGQTATVTYVHTAKKGTLYFSPDGKFTKIENNWLEKGRWRVNNRSLLCFKTERQPSKCRMLIENQLGLGQYVMKKMGNHKLELMYEAFDEGDNLFKRIKASSLPRERLTKEDIVTLFSGKTVKSKTIRKGRVSSTYYYPDGTLEIFRNSKKFNGLWRVSNKDRMCLKIGDSKEKCRIIVKQGKSYSKYIVKKKGNHQQSISYLEFVEGKRF